MKSLEFGMVWLGFYLVAPFQRLAARKARAEKVGTYIAVTGSVGKTTTVNLLSTVLGSTGRVSRDSFRNVTRSAYRSLLKLDGPVDYLVQEISAYPLGTIDSVGSAFPFDVGVVTTVGLDHRTAFRVVEGVAKEKVRLVLHVRPGGLVCLNADYPLVRAMAGAANGRRVVLYGRAADAEVRAENVSAVWPGGLRFDLVLGSRRRHVTTRLPGTLAVESTLAALSVVHGLGLDVDRAVAALADAGPPQGRLTPLEGSDGNTYFLDTVKASLWSTMLLADDLANWGDAHRTFVLGNLSDKGNDAQRRYRQVLRAALKTCDLVIGIGEARGAAQRLVIALERERNEGRLPRVRGRMIVADDLSEARAAIAAAPRGLVILKSSEKLRLDALVFGPDGVAKQSHSIVSPQPAQRKGR